MSAAPANVSTHVSPRQPSTRVTRRASIDPKNPGYREQYGVIVLCESEAHQRAVYERLHAAGHKLRVVTT